MSGYRRILYATDLSDNAAHAFAHAIGLARQYDAEVTVVHVLPKIDPSVANYVNMVVGEKKLIEFGREHDAQVVEAIRLRLKSFAEEELKDVPEDLKRVVAIEVCHGTPAAEILEMADRIEADLVVLGSHGKGRINYAFLGSVAEKVLRKIRRPVFIVPL